VSSFPSFGTRLHFLQFVFALRQLLAQHLPFRVLFRLPGEIESRFLLRHGGIAFLYVSWHRQAALAGLRP
jgi:hypothetical protein